MYNLSKVTQTKKFPGCLYANLYFDEELDIAKREYMNYKLGNLENFSEERLHDMEILSILDGLGFPMDNIGTYLYKNMIVKVVHHLGGTDSFGQAISQDKLLQQLKSPFSQFYFDVARNDLDMGIKTFHSYIEGMLENVNYENAEPTLLFEVYSNFSEETDYGEHAFIIGKYVSTTSKKEVGNQYIKQVPMVNVNV